MVRLLGVEPYALRYWEEEFPTLSPRKGPSGHKIYTEQDLATIRRIKELLYDQRFTIPGARQRLAEEGPGPNAESPASGVGDRVLVFAAGDKGGGAAIHLDATLDTARRIEQTLDLLAADGPRTEECG